MDWVLPDFNTADLADAVERLSIEQLNALPFGVILLDKDDIVVHYTDVERRQSGFPGETLGRAFFADIAPCMNNPVFRSRIDDAKRRGVLNIAFEHIGDFTDPHRSIRVRIQSASNGGCWMFLERSVSRS